MGALPLHSTPQNPTHSPRGACCHADGVFSATLMALTLPKHQERVPGALNNIHKRNSGKLGRTLCSKNVVMLASQWKRQATTWWERESQCLRLINGAVAKKRCRRFDTKKCLLTAELAASMTSAAYRRQDWDHVSHSIYEEVNAEDASRRLAAVVDMCSKKE